MTERTLMTAKIMKKDLKKKIDESNTAYWLALIALFLVLTAGVLFVATQAHDETIISGQWNGEELSESLMCEADNINYLNLNLGDAAKTTTKILGTFNQDRISSLSLVLRAYYNDENRASTYMSAVHAAMNGLFGRDNLGADAFNASYNIVNGALQMTLYASGTEIKGSAAKYFLLDNAGSNYTRRTLIKEYNKQGLDCVSTN